MTTHIKIETKNVNSQFKILQALLDYELHEGEKKADLASYPKLGFLIAVMGDGRVHARYLTNHSTSVDTYKKVPVYQTTKLLRELQACRKQS